MQVRETTLEELLGGVKQFRVPLFQRPYTWDDKNHAQLWRDIMAVYEAARDPEAGSFASVAPHFIGSFVLAPNASAASGLAAFMVVDGQQRLTTLMLVLGALRDFASIGDPTAKERINETYLVNRWQDGIGQYRLLPARQDREAFIAVVDDGPLKGGTDAIGDGYRYFASRLAEADGNGEPLDVALLERILVSKLAIVDITAQAGDNVHRIFESLNATGVSLTQADLLRNYLMMLLPTRADVVYEQVWFPMQQSLGADNLEGLARVDLQCRGLQVRSDDVYRMQQRRLQPIETDEDAIEAEIRALAIRAKHYESILNPDKEPDPAVRNHLRFLERWGAQTAHPLIVYLYELREEGTITSAEVAETLLNLESFMVRRLVTGASRKNLNRIFPQVARRLRDRADDKTIVEKVRDELSGERMYWASDQLIRSNISKDPFYFYGRAMQRRMVLERMEESFGHKEQTQLESLDLSLEHIMPQTLSDEWRVALEQAGQSPEEVHSDLKHTLGNLTLTAYNSELSNRPFERKQQILGDSHLSLNKGIVAQEVWGRSEIEERSAYLAELIIEIWPAPADVQQSQSTLPTWSRLHAAMAAIPPGNWASYADLAEVVGTSPQSVSSHVESNPTLMGAHRVLPPSGIPSEDSRWPDTPGTKNPRSIWVDEGLAFDAAGAASPDARLGADQLVELAGLLEETLDEDEPSMAAWTDELLKRCYRESPSTMKAFLEYLTARPDRTFTFSQMADAIQRTPNELPGVLGAFGKRVRNRYSMDELPFEVNWSDEAGAKLYRMEAEIAGKLSRWIEKSS